ncbi:MAG: DUF3592 domain-containing protein [Calditrichaceae bacterium]
MLWIEVIGSLSLVSVFVILVLTIRKKVPYINNYFFGIALLFVICGVILVYIEDRQFTKFQQYKFWENVSGEILETKITGERAIRPQVTYSYIFDGKVYVDSTNLETPGFGGRNNRRQTAANILKEYIVGSAIPVHVDPGYPEKSKIHIGVPWNVFGIMGFGGFLYILGFFGALAFLLRIFSRPED